MRLLIQPQDGALPLVRGITAARRSIEIVIFRFDQREIERALAGAVTRGVSVHALIAYTNRAGEENLRKLELRLLAQGVTVSRTADDLVRYHGKLMIVDRRELYLLAFNLTHLDIERSRSFGVITRTPELVREAGRLFEADSQRRAYEPGSGKFLVSPANARQQLSALIKGAKKELIIYDPKVSDPAMIRLLEARSRAGVTIRIIGQLTQKIAGVAVRNQPQIRLHARAIVRDGKLAFIGSQSLRELELNARREVGIIFQDAKAVGLLARTFENDWLAVEKFAGQTAIDDSPTPAATVAKRVAKALARDLPAVAPVLNGAVSELAGAGSKLEFNTEEVEEMVQDAVKEAVREVVRSAVEDAVEQSGGSAK